MLRDDLSQLLSDLIRINKNKYSLFEKIYRLDYECLHYVNAGDTEKAEDLLKHIEDLKTEIDTLEFDSGQTTDKILKTAGMDRIGFKRLIEKGGDEKTRELKSLNLTTGNLINKLIENREKLISRMGEINVSLEIDIKELELIRKIEIDKLDRI